MTGPAFEVSRGRLAGLLGGLVLALGLVACQPAAACGSAGCGPGQGAPGPAGATAAALSVVGSLTVRGRGPHTGYRRAQFGPAWADTDHNGCDTRNDVLARDLTDLTFRAGTRDCVVLSGRFHEPYTGREVEFRKADAEAVQIDHVVALSDAWQTGAAAWSPAERLAFANDPLELLATDGPTNQAKGDSDTASWLPPDRSYRCRYVARQVAVKRAYALSVTAAERDAMRRVLGSCPGETLPARG